MNYAAEWGNISGMVHLAFHRETCALHRLKFMNTLMIYVSSHADRAGKDQI